LKTECHIIIEWPHKDTKRRSTISKKWECSITHVKVELKLRSANIFKVLSLIFETVIFEFAKHFCQGWTRGLHWMQFFFFFLFILNKWSRSWQKKKKKLLRWFEVAIRSANRPLGHPWVLSKGDQTIFKSFQQLFF
jgi:hypothetical protein